MAVTREQQVITRKLEAAQEEYLVCFGWVREGRCWQHPKLKARGINCNFTMLDAMAQTRADPTLGWPERH